MLDGYLLVSCIPRLHGIDMSDYEITLLCVILSLEPGDIFAEREVTIVLLVAT